MSTCKYCIPIKESAFPAMRISDPNAAIKAERAVEVPMK